MKIEHKAVAVIGIAQLLTEYLEDLINDRMISKAFVRELKRDTNNFIRSSDKFMSYVSKNADMEAKEQAVDIYKVISRLVEEHIDWEQKEEKVS
jgi:uncharacterized protein (DUF2267 family)